jgi:hypothetical protein
VWVWTVARTTGSEYGVEVVRYPDLGTKLAEVTGSVPTLKYLLERGVQAHANRARLSILLLAADLRASTYHAGSWAPSTLLWWVQILKDIATLTW